MSQDCRCAKPSQVATRTAEVSGPLNLRIHFDSSTHYTPWSMAFNGPGSFRLQQRAMDPVPVALGGDVAPGDLLQRRAAAERHGDLELVLEHPQRVPHAGLAVRCEGEHHRPADLTDDRQQGAFCHSQSRSVCSKHTTYVVRLSG